MAISSIHIIPDCENLDKTLNICEKYNTYFEYNDFFNPVLLDDNAALTERIRMYQSLGRKAGCDTLHGVFYDICLNSIDGRIASLSRERIFSSIEIAHLLNCKGVVFHTNLIPGFETDYYLDNWFDKHVEFYSKLLNEFKDINIWIENMFDYRPDMLVRLCEAMKGFKNFGVCYDVAHSNLTSLSMEGWFEALAPYIRHLHINDNYGRIDEHNTVGDGNIDWKKYDMLIKKHNIDASALVEVKDLDKCVESLTYMANNNILIK